MAWRGVVAVLALWTLAEAFSPIHSFGKLELPLEKVRREVVEGPVLCVPVDGDLGYHAALQILHGEPISSGYLARPDAAQTKLRHRLRSALRSDSDELGLLVESLGYRSVLLTEPVPWFVYERLAAFAAGGVRTKPSQVWPINSITREGRNGITEANIYSRTGDQEYNLIR